MEETRVKLKGIQRIVARNMEKSSQIPRVTTIREVRMNKVAETRNKLKEKYPDKKVSFLTFSIMGLVKALEKYPSLNASFDTETDEIIYHDEINISFAITVGENLLVPVIKNANKMSFIELNDAIVDITNRARNNELKREDCMGGTITISNSGSLGGEIFTPLINTPQSAILGIGKIQDKVAVDENKQMFVCPMMYLCLTYDHRITNGSQAVGALGVIDDYFKNPVIE